MEEQNSPHSNSVRSSARSVLFKKRELPFFEGIGDYIRSRSPGDRFIFFILGLFIFITSLLAIIKLQTYILVPIPAYGGSITEGDVGAPRFVNPLLALSTTDQDLTQLTYAGLMGEGPNGTLVPVLAQRYIVSPDGKTYQFTLRPNLKFSDGSSLTADDVVYTIQKAQDAALKSPQFANWNGVQAVALDSRTVQITLPAPYANFLYDATLGILPAHLWRDVTDDQFPFTSLQTTPVGDGPFVVTHVNQDKSGNITSYNLSENPHYALGRPYLDSFNFIFYNTQQDLQTALTDGQIDSAYGVIGNRSKKDILTTPYSHVFAVFFNQNSSDLFFYHDTREALSVAIDREDIVKNVLDGYATALNGPVPPTNGVTPVPLPDSSTRIADAEAGLQSAGWTQDATTKKWTNSSGETLSITLTNSNVPELQALAEAIQKDWQQLGVQTQIQLVEPGDLSQSVIVPRNYQALLFGMVIGQGDDLYDFWDSSETTTPGLNITGFSDTKVDALLSQIRIETDPTARTAELSQLNTLISGDYPAAFIESPDFIYSVPKDLKGVILGTITAPSDRFANVASWYRRTESVWPFLIKNASF
jgi:peptide/nickel transport system substrate-binding protein